DDLEGLRFNQIIAAIERMGFQVTKARRLEDAEIAVQTDAAIGCMVVDWGKKGLEGKTASLINLMRKRGLEMPIMILVRRKRFEDIPVEVLDFIDGYVFLAEETPEFIAKNLVSRLKQYAETLKTPFFGELVDYSEEGNQLWTCPGHNGGIFYSRSPIGRIFVEHLGEAIFRDDLDNSVLELGDLLTHEGPALAAQKEAAAIFGAEKTYFVLNGTSSSNKIVLTNLIAEGDLVLFDRNNHKAAHHGALLIGGGVPIYLSTDRNAYGLIGPIRADALDEKAIRERIRTHPLVKDQEAWTRERPFRVAVIEQCTYDGTIYDARRIVERIGHLCDYILFDEAWAGFMKFHPIYEGRFAMGLKNLGEASPGVVATQSAHKQLASFSQASQIHVRDRHIKGQRRRVGHRRFNEGFMRYASTSPFYPLFASLDVGAQMMKGRSGEVLWDDTIRLGIELRKKIRAVRREFEEKEIRPERRWFFEPFVPDRVAIPDSGRTGAVHDVPWESVSTDQLASDPRYWQLAPDAGWHGFAGMEAGFAMTDPNKLTLLTPGFDRATGAYAEHGIPAPVVAQYLRENRIVAEKNDLNSLLFLLTPGVEASKAGTLVSGLVSFKKLHDENAPLEEVIPEFCQRRQGRHAGHYAGMRLRDLCGNMHRFFREAAVSTLQAQQFAPEHLPEIAMSPRDAATALTRNDVDYLPI
ncbi:MAG TPA: Orn/Lys/Arg decarboxylase N-terminal domain-containing protein, partial [Bradyrhizobium sp.]|nr:Orn/Lys/Arg decarboxylase N-terminal domain-containing protein [Bradyrhizobium sp.]